MIFEKWMTAIVGDWNLKKEYRQMMRRVGKLPKEYRFAFQKIQHYIYTVGGVYADASIYTDLTIFRALLELFETGAAEGRSVLSVTGEDVGAFADLLIEAAANGRNAQRESVNRIVKARIGKEEDQKC